MPRFLSSILLLGLLVAPAGVRLHAEEPAQPQRPITNENHMDAPDPQSETEEYRHSAAVQSIARMMHVKTETAAQIFEDTNSGILILVVVVLLVKVVPGILRKRSATLQKDLQLAHDRGRQSQAGRGGSAAFAAGHGD
jgi:F-type H+-transporting ATPase subunit b